MARLQILELPAGSNDDQPPFILVVDEYTPRRYITGLDQPEPVSEFDGIAEKIGARAVLVFEDTIDIPANEPPALGDVDQFLDEKKPCLPDARVYLGDLEVSSASSTDASERADAAERKLKALFGEYGALQEQLAEARLWARHGYEIGQRHCGWTDHGIAPAWLTEGWPPHIDSCEHLKQAAEHDEAVSRVRSMDTRPEAMDAQQEHPDVWLHGYECGVLAAKAAIRPRNEPTTKRTDA